MNILYSEPILYYPHFKYTIPIMIALVILFIFGLYIGEKHEGVGIAIILVTSVLFIIVAIVSAGQKPSGRKQYYVYFNDQASAEQIQESYTLIEQKGSMYIIEDK